MLKHYLVISRNLHCKSVRIGIVIALLILLSIIPTYAQNNWSYEMYDTINYTNFRSNSIVNKTFVYEDPDYPLLNALLFFCTNEKRVHNKVLPLQYHKACEIAAYNHSKKMVELDFFAHYNIVDKTRASVELRAKLAGISNPAVAENVAYKYLSYGYSYLEIADKFIDMWMKSEGHRNNILSEKGIQGGCGTFTDGQKIYATQVFQWFREIVEQDSQDSLPVPK